MDTGSPDRRLKRAAKIQPPGGSGFWVHAMATLVLFDGCLSDIASKPSLDCVGGGTCDAGCAQQGDACAQVTVDLPPVPRIRFQLQTPRDDGDYPYAPTIPPLDAPTPRSTVYLSAADSSDPEGKAISVFWNVQDSTGRYLSLDPNPGAFRVSFSPSFVGSYAITLEVLEQGGLRQIAQAMFTLVVLAHPCAADGYSPPCSDESAVPGGTFMAGSADDMGFANERPRHSATVAPFLMDKYEVTVGRFRRFLDAYADAGFAEGAGAHPLISGSGWQSAWDGERSSDIRFSISECGGAWTPDVGDSEARPIGCVTWYQAFAFCIWEGKRLPTEAEWEYAASGGDEQRTYPWGNDPPSQERAVYGCLFDGLMQCSDADLPPVGSVPAGAGRFGHLDLAGSLWEWTLDVSGTYTGEACDNCANLAVAADEARVFRGGDFKFDDPSSLRSAFRYGFDAKFPDQVRGFRCARTPTPSAQ